MAPKFPPNTYIYSGSQNNASITGFAQKVANLNGGSANDVVIFADFDHITREISEQNATALADGFGTDDQLQLNLNSQLGLTDQARSLVYERRYGLDSHTADQLVKATNIFGISADEAYANYNQNKDGGGWYTHFNNNANITNLPSGTFEPMD